MFNDLKLAFQSFKKNVGEYLAVSFIFGVMLLVGVLLSTFLVGPLIAFVIVGIPAIISLKFCVFHSYNKESIEIKNMKIGFYTFFKSLKIYSMVILKAFLIASLVGIFVFSLFYSTAIEMAIETIPNLYESLLNIETMQYAYEDMLKIDSVRNLLVIGVMVSSIISYVICFSIKLKRDFIPFIAFEMPINSKRAIDMNTKMVKGKYVKLFISNLVVDLMFLVPIGLAYLCNLWMSTNAVYSSLTVGLVSAIVACVLVGPVALIKQLHYVHNYKSYSKPFKEDFDNELKNIIKEIEELQKKINKN